MSLSTGRNAYVSDMTRRRVTDDLIRPLTSNIGILPTLTSRQINLYLQLVRTSSTWQSPSGVTRTWCICPTTALWAKTAVGHWSLERTDRSAAYPHQRQPPDPAHRRIAQPAGQRRPRGAAPGTHDAQGEVLYGRVALGDTGAQPSVEQAG